MITLKEAFKLCRVDDREVVHLCDGIENALMWSWPMTGLEIRNKYDMQRTMVSAIMPHFCVGEYEGFTFVISEGGKNQ